MAGAATDCFHNGAFPLRSGPSTTIHVPRASRTVVDQVQRGNHFDRLYDMFRDAVKMRPAGGTSAAAHNLDQIEF